MVLMDQKGVKIHAIIRQAHMHKFIKMLKAGMCYIFKNLLVAQTDPKFRATHHNYKLSFMGNTTVTDFVDDKIPTIDYQFMSFHDITTSGDEKYLIDVIGHLIQRSDTKGIPKDGKTHKLMDLILQDLEGIKLNCTLWDTFAEDIDVFFANHNQGESVIIILQYCRIKTYNGKNNITNSYYGTTMTINPKSKECEDYKEKLAMRDELFTQSVSHISSQRSIFISVDLLQTNRMTIADVVESTTVANGALLAKVIEIESEDKWWYESCVTCFKKVETSGTTFYCLNCDTMVMAVPRFRVQVKVIDDTGSASFVMFDRVIAQLLGRSASDIITGLRKEKLIGLFPREFDALIDKTFLFKVDISSLNVAKKWSVYTVNTMSNDDDLIQQFRTLQSLMHLDDEDDNSVENNAPQQDDNLKDFIIDCEEVTPSSKSLKKKTAEDVQDYNLSDDGATQMSSTKVLKKIKIENE
ncbi:hypothetical protein ABFS83_12G086200 [Erythranthe nasuta]